MFLKKFFTFNKSTLYPALRDALEQFSDVRKERDVTTRTEKLLQLQGKIGETSNKISLRHSIATILSTIGALGGGLGIAKLVGLTGIFVAAPVGVTIFAGMALLAPTYIILVAKTRQGTMSEHRFDTINRQINADISNMLTTSPQEVMKAPSAKGGLKMQFNTMNSNQKDFDEVVKMAYPQGKPLNLTF